MARKGGQAPLDHKPIWQTWDHRTNLMEWSCSCGALVKGYTKPGEPGMEGMARLLELHRTLDVPIPLGMVRASRVGVDS